jgi:biofilm PGA synthesis N-glycosyltransferase PgaC
MTFASNFVFYYPLFMAYLWMTGGILHFLLVEWKDRGGKVPELTGTHPKVSVVVPCFNEADNIREVIACLDQIDYPNYDIIAVNDGSRDQTGAILNELVDIYPKLTVIHQNKNEGKAVGLTTAAVVSDAEFLMCIDGDSLLDKFAVKWMLRHFKDPRVGAVTGNPRIRTRTSLLGRMQVGEFSCIVGLIKRTQQMYGRLLTLSGVVSMFRKEAVRDIGYWSSEILTEDIDISWKLQVNGWQIHFEPRALSWILMPETLKGLYKQRLRWAEGGIQVLFKYAGTVLARRKLMMVPIFLEYTTSVAWAYCMLFTIASSLVGAVMSIAHGTGDTSHFALLPHGKTLLIFGTCCIQMLLGCLLDHEYDAGLLRYFVDTIWFPVAFWAINLIASVVALPRVILRRHPARARWVSPDRGIRAGSTPTSDVFDSLPRKGATVMGAVQYPSLTGGVTGSPE